MRVWAQAAMIAAGVQLAVVRGKLTSPRWSLVSAVALLVSGIAFLVHEQNPWLYSRSAFLHHAIGWTAHRRRRVPARAGAASAAVVWRAGFALTFVAARGAPLRGPRLRVRSSAASEEVGRR